MSVQAYLQLFPFYATHFLGGYTGTVGFAIIFVFFFYYFAVILLAGAEVNAFYAQGKRALPDNLASTAAWISLFANQYEFHQPTLLS